MKDKCEFCGRKLEPVKKEGCYVTGMEDVKAVSILLKSTSKESEG